MNPQLKKWGSFAFFLLLGIGVSVIVLRNVDLGEIQSKLLGVDYTWLVAVIIVSITGQYVRALRWKMLLKASGHDASAHTIFVALSIGYFVNLGIPRAGEVTRCISLFHKANIPFNTSLGTVVSERTLDVITLVLLFFGVTIIAWEDLQDLFYSYKKNFDQALEGKEYLLYVVGILFVGGLIALFWWNKRLRATGTNSRLGKFVFQLQQGLLSVFRLKQVGLFVVYTAIIWVVYFFTTYWCFFTIDETAHLGIFAGIAITVYGSIARTIPLVAGSFGLYHMVVAQVGLLFALSDEVGYAIGFIIHSTQIVFYIVTGLYASIFYAFMKKVSQDSTLAKEVR